MNPSVPVLLIDDDEEYVDLMKMILEIEGYRVDYAYNGYEGIVKYMPGRYAAVITDYIMPILRGDEVAERIRRLDSDVGLILLTGYKPAISEEILQKFSSVLEKPVEPMQVLVALKKIVGEVSIEVLMR
jgi:CheY-like chemotaxis protein